MKKGKIFATIVYYFFTFAIGVLLAIGLPFLYMYYGESLNIMQKSLESGNYSKAMSLVGGYYDERYVYQTNFEKGGMVLFSAASLAPKTIINEDETEEVIEAAIMHKAYSGFVYGVYEYFDIVAEVNNQSKLVVHDYDGETHIYEFLDTDTNDDKVNDSNSVFLQNGFFYIDFDQDTFISVKTIDFIDKNGNVAFSVTPELKFDQTFFADVTEFVNEYNTDYKSEKLASLDEKFRDKSEFYKISDDGIVKSSADKKATIVVLVYFIAIYIIGDFLLGYHTIIRFFKWVLVKVFKVQFKSKKAPNREEIFGHDYNCKFTLSIDTREVPDFSESVQVRYSKDDIELVFILLRENNYTVTQLIKADEYVNLWVDLSENYKTQGLPDTLVVEGYHKNVIFKILKREGK